MDELFKPIFSIKKRTEVTSLFAQRGFKIRYTDFDKVVFEQDEIQVEVSFNSQSHIEAIYIASNEKEICAG